MRPASVPSNATPAVVLPVSTGSVAAGDPGVGGLEAKHHVQSPFVFTSVSLGVFSAVVTAPVNLIPSRQTWSLANSHAVTVLLAGKNVRCAEYRDMLLPL